MSCSTSLSCWVLFSTFWQLSFMLCCKIQSYQNKQNLTGIIPVRFSFIAGRISTRNLPLLHCHQTCCTLQKSVRQATVRSGFLFHRDSNQTIRQKDCFVDCFLDRVVFSSCPLSFIVMFCFFKAFLFLSF